MVRPTSQPKTHQQSVRTRKLQAFIGMEGNNVDALNRNYVNADPQAAQVSTIQATTSTLGADYVFTFNGVVYTMTEDGTTTGVNDIATQLGAFIENEGSIYGFVDVAVATDTVTLTGKLPGFSWTISDADAKITTTESVTAAADAAEVTFGRMLARGGYAAASVDDVEDALEQAALADVNYFTAQVDDWTLGDPSGGSMFASLDIKGLSDGAVSVSVPWTTNLATTIDLLDVAINQWLVDKGYDAYVVVTNDATSLIFTAQIAGVEFSSQAGSDTAATHSLASNKDLTTASSRTSLHASLAGIALRVADQEADLDFDSATVGAYDINSTMKVRERGDVWVSNSQTIVAGQQVYVDVASGEGLCYNTAGATRIPLSLDRAEWVRGDRSSDGLSLLRLL